MKGFRYAPIGPFLENRREEGPVPRPQLEAEAVALALHVVLSKEAVSPKYRERLQAYHPEGFRTFANSILPDSVSSDLTDWLENGARSKGVEELATILRRKLTFARPGNLLRRAYVRLYAWSGFFTPRKGFLVALVGPDGGGKSTISSLTRRTLPRLPTPVSSIYMGKKDTVLPTSRFIRWLSTRFGETSLVPGPPPTGSQPANTSTDGDAAGGVSPVARVTDTLGLLNWLLEQWYRYLFEIRPVLQQEGVVLTDRYFVDFVQRPDFSLAHRRLVRRLLIRIFPEPDIAVLLSADPAVLQQRKPEHDVEQSAVTLARFRAAVEQYSTRMEIRTDTGTASGNASDLANAIVDSMADRYDG